MALTGELSDLSLAELIEIFCNQRKSGRLTVEYEPHPGHFYIHKGEIVDAELGSLTGVNAIYHALTLPSASFIFDTKISPSKQTITDSWRLVLLEGLRRLDEGLYVDDSSNHQHNSQDPALREEPKFAVFNPKDNLAIESNYAEAYSSSNATEFNNQVKGSSVRSEWSVNKSPKLILAGAIGAVLLLVIAIGVISEALTGSSTASEHVAKRETIVAPSPEPASLFTPTPLASSNENKSLEEDNSVEKGTDLKAEDDSSRPLKSSPTRESISAKSLPRSKPTPKPKRVESNPVRKEQERQDKSSEAKTVNVNLMIDEQGRVAQAVVLNQRPGMAAVEAAAVRAARQRRFGPGKSKWITVPIQVN
jgi:TonB family protein